ncbi:cell wall-associated NlpC family hydrolase [Catenulispora sp. GP43]|uniref:C40 family peptidase n=1 Tax=Catenulispora sp. GP43 TaxID=3156263 RepID=UPI00351689E1
MRGRGHGRRAALVTATVLTAALLGAAAHADPGTPVTPGQAPRQIPSRTLGQTPGQFPGQDAVDRAEADVRDRQSAADHIQEALDAASARLHTLLARVGLAAEAYDTAVAQAATAAQAAAAARNRAVAALDAQHQAEQRLGTFAAETYRQGPDLAAAQGLELGLERQHEAGLAALAAQQAAVRQSAAAAAAALAAQQAAARQSAAASSASGSASASGGAAHTQAPAVADGASTWTPTASASPMPSAGGAVRLMLNYIYAQLGKPYVWGGAGPDVFDCSGLAMRGLEAGGWSYPHPAQWQYLAMHPLTYAQLRPGDLVFWAEDAGNPHTIYHEAVYIGNDSIIQAPHPGGVVEQQSLWINGTPAFYGRP